MFEDKKIAVLLPCYNEEQSIEKVVTDFRHVLPSADIYVYDNNSTDSSASLAEKAGAIVIIEPAQGKGNVIRSMFSDINADIYIMSDADDTYNADDAPRLIQAIIEGYDIAIGDRLSTNYYEENKRPMHNAGVLIKALGIGAQPVQLCWLQFLPYCNPREKGFGVSVNFTNHACMDLGLVVDRKTGKRFMDEHAGRKIKSDALFKVIGTDENYPIAICDDAIVKAINPSFVKLPLEMGTVKKFDTLEQLADAFGIPKQALLDEVAKFNGYVKANDDKDFHRILTFNKGLDVSKAPFYGIEVSPKIHHTMGGVMINENAEVISANTHKPIPGLYAGGEVAGGVHGASRLGTVAVIDALTFGMIAGENFAKMQ